MRRRAKTNSSYKKRIDYNVRYSFWDPSEDELRDFMVILPSYWKVIWWFVRRGRKACEIHIWTSVRN